MKIIELEENDANQRLDKFLKKLFPNATRSLIYKLNRKSKIKVKSLGEDVFKKRDNEFKLSIGDVIKLFVSDKDFDELREQKVEKESGRNRFDKNDIVYEDGDLFVVNKAAGVNVHPGDFKTKELSIISQVQDYLGEKLNSLTFKPSLVHRIDRDTSGILLIAKKKDILSKLVNDLKNHEKIKKTYTAFVFGKPNKPKATITKKLLRIKDAKDENKVQISDKGQTAITHYKVVGEYYLDTNNGKQIVSEIECEIETGRMHQIRVHLTDLGTPIIGDNKYGDKKLNSFIARNYGLSRQALHASKISLFHYGRNKQIELTARLKDDMKNFLEKLNK